jgi:hypothetical protein
MGQGAEDAGGYELEYDPAYEGLASGRWNDSILVTDMSVPHLRNALRRCRQLSGNSTFSYDDDKWDEWIDILETELDSRSTPQQSKVKSVSTPKQPVRGRTQKMRCHCGNEYDARLADLKRGWAKSCSKSCAAIRRDFGRPAAKKVK